MSDAPSSDSHHWDARVVKLVAAMGAEAHAMRDLRTLIRRRKLCSSGWALDLIAVADIRGLIACDGGLWRRTQKEGT